MFENFHVLWIFMYFGEIFMYFGVKLHENVKVHENGNVYFSVYRSNASVNKSEGYYISM